MARISRCLLIALLVIGISTPTQKTHAGGTISGFATEVTQILNNIELAGLNLTQIKALANQAQQLVNEALMIEMQIKNLLVLADNPLALVNSLTQLSSVVERGQILSYVASNIEGDYQTKYEGYTTYETNGITSDEIIQKYTDWSQDNEDNIIAHLESAGLQEETIENEEARVAAILLMSQSSEGRLQAIQAGNQIAAEQVRGLQRLRKLMLDQAQFNANFAAIEKDKDDVDLVKWREVTSAGVLTNTADGSDMSSSILSLP